VCSLSLILRPDAVSGVFGPANMDIGDGGIPVIAKPSLMIPVVAIFQGGSVCSLAKSRRKLVHFNNCQSFSNCSLMSLCGIATIGHNSTMPGERQWQNDTVILKTAQTKIPTLNSTNKLVSCNPININLVSHRNEPCRHVELNLCLPLQASPKSLTPSLYPPKNS
jgi:hypothetical protein